MRAACVVAVVLSSTCFAPHVFAGSGDAGNNEWRFSLDASWRYGPTDGYVQIPSGGQPGTTSSHRPRFSEIGISDASIYDVEFDAAWRQEQIYLGGQFIRLSGDDTLDDTLITHSNTFNAGTHVNSNVQLDWYRFGYRHQFALLADRNLTISPGVGGALLDFSYHLDTSGAAGPSASRSFIHATPQLVLNTEWQPSRNLPLSFELNLMGSPWVTSSIPGIFDEELLARYRVIANPRLSLAAYLGVAFEQIRFHDNQPVPNEIHADFGPMLVLGLRLSF
jgi:hypothetical protein